MKIAVARATNAIHLKYAAALKKLGQQPIFFDIDSVNWQDNFKKLSRQVRAVVWHSNDKGKYYREIHDRVYLIEKFYGLPIFPNMRQYFSFNDKIKQYDIFKYLKIEQPQTFITYQKPAALAFAAKTKYPFVLKDAYSASALGVFLITSQTAAKKIIEQIFSPAGYNSIYYHFYAQEFVPNLDRSLRIITIGDQTAAAYWRISENSWKHNVSEGRVSEQNIPRPALKIAERISQSLKYHWMSYDFIVKKTKILCLESSGNFGVRGANRLGYDIRLKQMEYLADWLKKRAGK